MQRLLAGETAQHVGEKIKVEGWVHSVRKHGKITFIDLRDRSGLLQVVTNTKLPIKPESVVSVEGSVAKRPDSLINEKIVSGTVELQAENIEVINPSIDLPFPLDTDGLDIEEDLRMKYRYLDLRRSRLQENIKLRSKYVQAIREYLFGQDFTEIETPMLTKSTPEGSRDFVVPSRKNPGKFYALPQSPQQYKQLLMVGGFEKYFQVARCLRDEDPRADRAFEHTQIDLEMSFVEQQDVMQTVEDMVVYALDKVGYGEKIIQKPFPIITYQDAMQKFGEDKFDLRTAEEKQKNMLAFAWVVKFPFYEQTDDGGWTFTHNPFSAPIKEHEDWQLQKEHVGEITAQQYDLVCNGHEVGGGSIRTCRAEMLRSTFEIMGYGKEEINEKFGHMLEAFSYGAPPHGGCAHGVERMIMLMQNEEFTREVQAFPQTGRGRTSVMEAPEELDPSQLLELKLEVTTTKKRSGDEIYQEIIDLIKSNKVKEFKEYIHEPVFTSEEAAKIRGTELSQGAKALVMYGDKKPIMIVLSASRSADLKALKKWLKVKDLRMASKDEVKQITNLQVGSIPPFGSLFGLQTYADESLGESQEIVFNAGLHIKSIKIRHSDWLKVESPTVGFFGK